MGRIKNDKLYIFDNPTSKFDKVIGSDADNFGRTKNYSLGDIFALFTSLSGGGTFSYTYTPNLSTLDILEGLFATNDSETDPDGVNLLRFSRTDLFGNDLRTLVENYNNNSDGVVLKVTSEADPNLICAYTITGINADTNWVEISVLRHKNLNTLTFEADKNFSLTFDLVNLNGFGGGGGATNTSQLVNDGEDGINPFISLQDLITDHTALSNIGVNTHDQIDSHIADNTIHFTQASISITESQISDLKPYLLSETDPVFSAWLATPPNVSIFTNDAGYLTSFNETDPIFLASPAGGITNTDITNWNTAFGWGNHALSGYIRVIDIDTFSELDGIVADASLVKAGDNISIFTNDAGYLTSFTETDTLQSVTDRGSSTTNSITTQGLIVNFNEATFNGDVRVNNALFLPQFSPVSGKNLVSVGQNGGQTYAVTDNSDNWDIAYGWGDHAGLYVGLTGDETVAGLKTFTNSIYTGGNIRLQTVGNKLEFGNANVAIQRTSNNLELGGYDKIIFKSSNTGIDSQIERMRIISTGNVGIGNTSPSEKLDVIGNIKLSETAATTDTDKFAVLDTGVIKYRTGTQVLSDIGGTSETLSQNISFGESYASNYRSIVLDSGGTFFPRPLGYEMGLMEEQNLFKKAKLTLLPSGVGVGSLYNVKPKNDTFDFTRNSKATYVDEDGLIVVASSNTPRIDYSDGNCPSLLLEPERDNSFTYSEDFSQSYWGLYNSETTRTLDNAEINPYGTNGSYIIESVGGSGKFGITMTVTPSTDYTISFYVKNIDATNLRFFITNSSVSSYYYTSEVNTDTWTRVEVNFTSQTGTSCTIQLTRDLAIGQKIYLWGVQLEESSYPTSYIPTNGSVATRVAETCNNAGNASTFNDSKGVLFIEAAALVAGSNSQITLSDGTNDNVIILRFDTNIDRLSFFIRGNVGAYAVDFTAGVTQTDSNKIALVWDATNLKIWLNGVEAGTVAVNDLPIGLNKLNLSEPTGISNFYGRVKQLQCFDTALTDLELQVLTT